MLEYKAVIRINKDKILNVIQKKDLTLKELYQISLLDVGIKHYLVLANGPILFYLDLDQMVTDLSDLDKQLTLEELPSIITDKILDTYKAEKYPDMLNPLLGFELGQLYSDIDVYWYNNDLNVKNLEPSNDFPNLIITFKNNKYQLDPNKIFWLFDGYYLPTEVSNNQVIIRYLFQLLYDQPSYKKSSWFNYLFGFYHPSFYGKITIKDSPVFVRKENIETDNSLLFAIEDTNIKDVILLYKNKYLLPNKTYLVIPDDKLINRKYLYVNLPALLHYVQYVEPDTTVTKDIALQNLSVFAFTSKLYYFEIPFIREPNNELYIKSFTKLFTPSILGMTFPSLKWFPITLYSNLDPILCVEPDSNQFFVDTEMHLYRTKLLLGYENEEKILCFNIIPQKG